VDVLRFCAFSQWAKCQDEEYQSSEFTGTKGRKNLQITTGKWSLLYRDLLKDKRHADSGFA
jgi:hypothetical protein